jgi:hypothetical protein
VLEICLLEGVFLVRIEIAKGEPVANFVQVPLSKEEKSMAERKKEDDLKDVQRRNRQRGVFDGLVIYINGSTYPM